MSKSKLFDEDYFGDGRDALSEAGRNFYFALSFLHAAVGKVKQPHPEILVFDGFDPRWCSKVLAIAEQAPSEPPNSMNKYGKMLSSLGLMSDAKKLLKWFVKPLVRISYPDVKLTQVSGFIVDYSKDTQKKLTLHYDQSDVTMNICLGRKFTGGDLVFCNKSGKPEVKIKQKVGQVVLHRGTHLHRTEPLKSGKRSNLILWCTEK